MSATLVKLHLTCSFLPDLTAYMTHAESDHLNKPHTGNMLTYFSVGRNLWHKNYGEEMCPSETSKVSQRGGCHCVYLLQHSEDVVYAHF